MTLAYHITLEDLNLEQEGVTNLGSSDLEVKDGIGQVGQWRMFKTININNLMENV